MLTVGRAVVDVTVEDCICWKRAKKLPSLVKRVFVPGSAGLLGEEEEPDSETVLVSLVLAFFFSAIRRRSSFFFCSTENDRSPDAIFSILSHNSKQHRAGKRRGEGRGKSTLPIVCFWDLHCKEYSTVDLGFYSLVSTTRSYKIRIFNSPCNIFYILYQRKVDVDMFNHLLFSTKLLQRLQLLSTIFILISAGHLQ